MSDVRVLSPRPLPGTSLRVPCLGLGTVKLGRLGGLKYPAGQQRTSLPSDEEALQLLRAAHELGVSLIDTAPAYGASESRLGGLLRRIAPRDSWTICTKAGEEWEGESSRFDFSAAAITGSVRRSLERLQSEWLDIVLLHMSGQVDDVEVLTRGEALGVLRDAQRAGLVRAVGASTSTPAGAALAVTQCDVVMLTLNSQHRADLPAIASASAHGVGVLVKKPLASGVDAPAALPSVLRVPGVSAAVIGTSRPDHLREAVEAARSCSTR